MTRKERIHSVAKIILAHGPSDIFSMDVDAARLLAVLIIDKYSESEADDMSFAIYAGKNCRRFKKQTSENHMLFSALKHELRTLASDVEMFCK